MVKVMEQMLACHRAFCVGINCKESKGMFGWIINDRFLTRWVKTLCMSSSGLADSLGCKTILGDVVVQDILLTLDDLITFGNKIHIMLKLGFSIDEDNADGDVVMLALEEADVTQRARWKKSIERTILAYNCYNF
ncbi:hypothetical protein Tco_1412350 [Tanacetum coccineum]